MSGEGLDGRVALVTGGSGGIGAELSVRLAAAGAAVGVHFASGKGKAEQIVARINEMGGRAFAVAGAWASPR